jgi:large subunit ribosomal protein L6
MSKIGKKPINTAGVQVTIKGNEIHYKGKNHSGVYNLPSYMTARLDNEKLFIEKKAGARVENCVWGLHRALIANALVGAVQSFERAIEINGLGFKAALTGNSVQFTLGYTHKITLELPKEVKLVIDKTGQKLTFTSFDKQKLGQICALVRSLRPPEPYKGTGIKYTEEIIRKKAGKAKAGAEGAPQ